MDVLKKSSQRPAALASLPVVAKKRCIFNVHCPRQQLNLTTHENKEKDRNGGMKFISGSGSKNDRESDKEKEREKEGVSDNIWLEDENGMPPPPSNTPLVIEPGGVYFRPEGAGGKYIAGVSPPAEQVRCFDICGNLTKYRISSMELSIFR